MSQTLWNLTTAIAVIGCVLFGLILRRLHQKQTAVSGPFQPLVLRFQYAAKDVNPCAVEKRFTWLFLVMLFYVGLALAVVAHNATDLGWLKHTMYAFAALGCFLGALESLCVIKRAQKAAPLFGLGKWACFAVWTAGMFAGLFIKGWAL